MKHRLDCGDLRFFICVSSQGTSSGVTAEDLAAVLRHAFWGAAAGGGDGRLDRVEFHDFLNAAFGSLTGGRRQVGASLGLLNATARGHHPRCGRSQLP